MSQTNDITPPLPVLMPREQRAFTVREMQVGEVRRIPRYAIKLNAEGRCFIFTDRQVTPLAVDHEPNGVTIERLAEGYHITIPADEVWPAGSLEEMQREGGRIDDAEPVMSLAVGPAASPAGTGTVELAATLGATTFIRIGFDTTIDASQVIGIRRFVEEADRGDVYFANIADDTAVVLTLIQMRGGAHYASRLSLREIDNRLRKAGHRII